MDGPFPRLRGDKASQMRITIPTDPGNRWVASMKPSAARKFPVPANEFPVPRKKIPCSEKNRESAYSLACPVIDCLLDLPQTVQIAVRFRVDLHQNGTKQAEFRKIPCYFP